ncbi:MAG: riboflavin biosynthesis protein RibF [Bacteroidales bacterium]|nr:riboflavin biosynthesis protein RibF [Bacteroidales bacterium]
MKVFHEISNEIPKNCVATVGVFDGVHTGHQYIIGQVKQMAEKSGAEELVITMNPHPAEFFGRKISFLSTMDEKLALFENFGVRNLLVLNFNSEIAALSGTRFIDEILVSRLSVSRLLLGYNNSIGHKENGVSEIYSGKIPVSRLDRFHLDYSDDISSSSIRNLLASGDVSTANRYLGYNYCISGTVVHGRGVGRTIGFPTANINVSDSRKVVPANGVYIASVCVDGKNYEAMLNIGFCPTFGGKTQSIELHILGCSSDLYGKNVKVSFCSRIRGEQRFDNVEKLVDQLGKDRSAVEEYFRQKPLSL